MKGTTTSERERNGPAGKPWRSDVLVAVAYLALAILKLAFIPTVAVWPSVGVAFAAALLLGDRAWRGIFLGSILANSAWAFGKQMPLFTQTALIANFGI